MSGYEGRSSRLKGNLLPNKIADAAAAILLEHLKESGRSERELCVDAGLTRRVWRNATGRRYPSDPTPSKSLLSLRDFIAIAQALRLDPIKILTAAFAAPQASSESERG